MDILFFSPWRNSMTFFFSTDFYVRCHFTRLPLKLLSIRCKQKIWVTGGSFNLYEYTAGLIKLEITFGAEHTYQIGCSTLFRKIGFNFFFSCSEREVFTTLSWCVCVYVCAHTHTGAEVVYRFLVTDDLGPFPKPDKVTSMPLNFN